MKKHALRSSSFPVWREWERFFVSLLLLRAIQKGILMTGMIAQPCGQCQRTAIARAVVNQPKVIFADEPTGALDKENAGNIMDIFARIKERGTTIVMVTHDKEISQMADRKIVISDGRIV